MWEASVSIAFPHQPPYPTATFTRSVGQLVTRHAAILLADVGDPHDRFWHTDSASVHLRVRMRTDEIRLLPNGWREEPAIDRGGHEDRMSLTPPWPLDA